MFKGKTVLIIGSSTGIGRAVAKRAFAYNAKVVVHGRTLSKELEKTAKEVRGLAMPFDVSDKKAVTEGIKEIIKKHKKIDAVINSAGIPMVQRFLESTDEGWRKVFDVNVMGTVHVCQAVIPYMLKAGGGHIVNISSVRGHDTGAGIFNSPYSASKAAVKNLTVSLAKEFGPQITVNSVSPGFTETAFSKTWPETVWKQAKSVLLKRTGKPNDIAEAICFLASENSGFITGQDMVVDGGLLVSGVK